MINIYNSYLLNKQNPELTNHMQYRITLTIPPLVFLYSPDHSHLHPRQNTGALMPMRLKARCWTGVGRLCTGCLGSGTRASTAEAPHPPRASGEPVSGAQPCLAESRLVGRQGNWAGQGSVHSASPASIFLEPGEQHWSTFPSSNQLSKSMTC
jgi:hypothetical protein